MATSKSLEVHLGEHGFKIGRLFLNNGQRSGFSYYPSWLQHPRYFNISPDLQAIPGIQYPKYIYFFALQDTAPDSWGERVIRRAHAKLRQTNKAMSRLAPIDFLLWVDDASRIGALRIFDQDKQRYLRTNGNYQRIPPLIELSQVLNATTALEQGNETTDDLQYLLGRGTSLGGARPKSTVQDTDGSLALGKFPSMSDQRDVIRGEVMAMQLAQQAGIDAAQTRVELINGTAIAIIKRFDRNSQGVRIPYLSAASMLQTSGRNYDYAYSDLVDTLLTNGSNPINDAQQLWRRLAFNYLICNTDDHLQNTGFLYDARNKGWRLSPAFDINPMPGNLRESKTWLTEDTGPINSKVQLIENAPYFRIDTNTALNIWEDIINTIKNWKGLAKKLGMNDSAITDYESAFLLE